MEKTYCKNYPKDEVLPDEQGDCSLCNSSLNDAGECQGDAQEYVVHLCSFTINAPDEGKAMEKAYTALADGYQTAEVDYVDRI